MCQVSFSALPVLGSSEHSIFQERGRRLENFDLTGTSRPDWSKFGVFGFDETSGMVFVRGHPAISHHLPEKKGWALQNNYSPKDAVLSNGVETCALFEFFQRKNPSDSMTILSIFSGKFRCPEQPAILDGSNRRRLSRKTSSNPPTPKTAARPKKTPAPEESSLPIEASGDVVFARRAKASRVDNGSGSSSSSSRNNHMPPADVSPSKPVEKVTASEVPEKETAAEAPEKETAAEAPRAEESEESQPELPAEDEKEASTEQAEVAAESQESQAEMMDQLDEVLKS